MGCGIFGEGGRKVSFESEGAEFMGLCIDEYGFGVLLFLVLPGGVGVPLLAFSSSSRAAASGLGLPALAYDEKAFLKYVFFFCGVELDSLRPSGELTEALCGRGLALRDLGWKSSPKTLTKLDGNAPTIRRSRFSLPTHQEPSPALRHSMRSPSMKPRSCVVY